MKKIKSFITGLACLAAVFSSCTPEGEEKDNTLEVAPATDMEFQATDNEKKVLTVTTDAAEWSFSKPEWVNAVKEGSKLTVNVQDNTETKLRIGRLTVTAGNAPEVKITITQEALAEGVTAISVTPSDPIAFKANANKAVVLTVKISNATQWDFVVPDWITATKDQENGTLTVNAKDNNGGERSGFITVKTDNDKKVNIHVSQEAESETGGPVNGVKCSFENSLEFGNTKVAFGRETTASRTLVFTLSQAVEENVTISVSVDENYLNEYNYINSKKCVILPDGVADFENTVTISAGSTSGSLNVSFDGSSLELAKLYLLPLKAVVTSGDVTMDYAHSRVNYELMKQNPREIKQLCVMEVNDANPLNVLEWKLEDGSYFFDAIAIFSGNMGWVPEWKRVAFNYRQGDSGKTELCNTNINQLISEYETYIKPIHDAGIKVYMGIMPHHTAAGIKTLSHWGCEQFAIEMAEIIKDCYMDGVFLDEEYVGTQGGAMTPEWGDNPAGASYFAYQMDKKMEEMVPWETDVAIYQYGLYVNNIEVEGKTVDAATFSDIQMGNYGSQGIPAGSQTIKQCTGLSIECAENSGLVGRPDSAEKIKNDGYGWIAWFAWDGANKNGRAQKTSVENVAKGCYGLNLAPVTGKYVKSSNDSPYDPKRYNY